MFQKTILAGHIGKDAEMRYTPQGTAVSNFSMAVNSGWGDTKTTTWFRVTIWSKLAENLTQYLTKGKLVLVEGELQPDPETGGPRIWTDTNGTTRASFEVTARGIALLGDGSKPNDEKPEEENSDIPF